LSGAELRLGRLFDRDSGRAFVAAIDHGLTIGVPAGAEQALPAIERVVNLQPDAVLLSPGMLGKAGHLFAFRGAPAPLVRADFIINDQRLAYLGEQHRVLISPEDANALGANGILLFLILGVKEGEMFADNVQVVGQIAQEAHRVGLPLIVETTLWGSQIPAEAKRDPDLLAFGARVAAELGADAVKTEYTGNPETMAQVIAGCPVPVLVLGGPKTNSPEALVRATRDAMAAGAKGVVYGRNVWQADNPPAMARQLRAAIHGHTSVAR